MPNPFMCEVWLDVPDIPGYQISSFGRLRSRRPIGGRGPLAASWRLLKLQRLKSGYLFKQLIVAPRRAKMYYIHALVLRVFIGERPPGHVARHLDGDRSNNRLSNLAWSTQKVNLQDRWRHGTMTYGSQHPWAKLTESDVLCIRARRAAGESYKSIAANFGVRWKHVWQICTGQRWGWLRS